MAIYRWGTKLAWVWKSFNPENSWTEWQFLKKTSTWYAFDNIPEVEVDSELSPTSENPVQNKVITNALQNAWWSSDHLEVKAPVWELYQLTDTMFLQNTPTLEDSTVEQKVWDTANNTQIHIQRIASWTGSNELKLKVKKVWTPWDLSVQVMSWIQVTVTANVDAYWYWDSNNVLASWTVSASSITTSWQEITVTLDDEVWWTEWELLDIVLSIPSVNASNYVVIACDSTQWSEWFSLVAVNGSTRTRSKIMPYCISDGFAQFLFSKYSDNYINITESDTILYNRTSTIYWDYRNYKTIYTTTAKTANYEFYLNTTLYGSSNMYCRVLINWTETIVAKDTTKTQTLSLNKGDIIDMQAKGSQGGVDMQARVTEKLTKIYKNNWKINKVFVLKDIWQKLTGYLFGMLPTWEWRDGN